MELVKKDQGLTRIRYEIKVEPGKEYTATSLAEFVNETLVFGYTLSRMYDIYILTINKD